MRQPLRALCAATALGLGLTALAACSDDPDPRIGGDDDPSTEAAPPDSSEPATTAPATDGTTATEPTEPPSSEAPEGETKRQFVVRWLEESQRMQNTGDTEGFLALSRDCQSCETLAQTVSDYYSAGGTISWDGGELLRFTSYDPTRNEFLAVYESGDTRYRERKGSPLRELSGGRQRYVIQFERKGDSWLILAADRLVD
ncbi:hypothetical protein GCM10023340_05940 [Nocardioides marinquilinus]|uniref:Lipoprotein n=1 Tax=Nocardioides marinquilinus TaxID=1210400 RepID=A0ABP9P8B4_9ACTN